MAYSFSAGEGLENMHPAGIDLAGMVPVDNEAAADGLEPLEGVAPSSAGEAVAMPGRSNSHPS